MQPTIGLEIHVELKTNSKMFCDCANDPSERHPNINVCPICLGHPGVLPVINQAAINMVIKAGLALNCQIAENSHFDRKNYFYPDLPKGYQISQYYEPICRNGFLELEERKIKIREIHLEEDTGRLVHEKSHSLVDFNRAGVPLMELATDPDLKSAKEAKAFAEELRLIFWYLGISDADMEKGQMRVEANISVAKPGEKLGTKVEIKNLNSFKAVEKAIDYEIVRQAKVLEAGKKVIQETRGWDDAAGETVSQRTKEEAQDYRYFPEPDLPPLVFTGDQIREIQASLPELPQARRLRLKKEYGLKDTEAEIFVKNKDFGEYFEKVVSELDPNLSQEKLSKLIKLASNYLITDLQGLLKGASVAGEDFLITPENFAEFIALINDGKLSSKMAKDVLAEMFRKGVDPSRIIDDRGFVQISDESEIRKIAKEVIAQNQKAVEDFKKGKENALQFLVGQVMAKTRGKANPETSRAVLLTELK